MSSLPLLWKMLEWPCFIQSLDRYHDQGLLYFGIWLHPCENVKINAVWTLEAPMLAVQKASAISMHVRFGLGKMSLCQIENFTNRQLGAFQQNSLPEKNQLFPGKTIMNWGLLPLNEARIYHHQLRGGRSAKWTPEKKKQGVMLHCTALLGWFVFWTLWTGSNYSCCAFGL